MLFNSLQFWLFFAIVFLLYSLLPHRAQNRMLLVASLVFYGAWDWRFLFLLGFSSTIDYFVARALGSADDPVRRKRLLCVSLVTNLGLLGIFKYLGFFVESFTSLLARFGLVAEPTLLHIILPVGISFFTFQTLSYTIDVYRRKIPPTRNYLDFALFVSFFPQLLAGPIERASHLIPEILAPRKVTLANLQDGAVLCLIGLVKKVVIADGLAGSVAAVYADPNPSGADVLLATWAFAIQIYCDFSGYTDIARGVAKMLGFSLMLNFAQPYFCTNPQEFWRRWHISLSTWLRDYLYIPLGGNRGGELATYRNLMLTMILGGLWHGAAWTFVLWGGFQGALLSLHRALVGNEGARTTGPLARVGRVLLVLLFFQVTCYGWLLFRAGSLEQIIDFTGRLLMLQPSQFAALSIPTPPLASFAGILFLFAWDLAAEFELALVMPAPMVLRAAVYAGMIYLLVLGGATPPAAFIYFRF